MRTIFLTFYLIFFSVICYSYLLQTFKDKTYRLCGRLSNRVQSFGKGTLKSSNNNALVSVVVCHCHRFPENVEQKLVQTGYFQFKYLSTMDSIEFQQLVTFTMLFGSYLNMHTHAITIVRYILQQVFKESVTACPLKFGKNNQVASIQIFIPYFTPLVFKKSFLSVHLCYPYTFFRVPYPVGPSVSGLLVLTVLRNYVYTKFFHRFCISISAITNTADYQININKKVFFLYGGTEPYLCKSGSHLADL